MDFPEPPIVDLPASAIFTCPCCNKKIGAWVVSEVFNCPSCNKPLTANKRQAIHRGLAVGACTYGGLTILMYLLGPRVPEVGIAIYGLGAVLAFYAGFFTYRASVVITKRQG